ncbi:hypothetical protein EASAB2608_01688 [Streptomyces sp. EAS-AB2608]|uniref:Uncharacterized protein n=1 Tax=Streptomyces bangladeshensis TaxID=295352 RepID=A0ABP5N4V3_9ACTN|nr:hypothetical protein EASAB2608_01688 [Streptomyces sp. EAS-AB2608]
MPSRDPDTGCGTAIISRTFLYQVMSDSHEAPADCPATLRPWRGAPGEDQAVHSKVHGKRGPLARFSQCGARGPGRSRESPVSKRMR